MPKASLSLPPGEGGYILQEIGDRLRRAGNGINQVMIMEGPEGVAVADAPLSMPGLTRAAAADVTGGREITHLIYSHGHGDHVGAAAALAPEGSGIEIVAHAATARQIARGAPCLDCVDVVPPSDEPASVLEEAEHPYNRPLRLHCYRTYWWGVLLAQADGLRFDPELLMVASLLHGLGIAPDRAPVSQTCCFSVLGGQLAEASRTFGRRTSSGPIPV